MNIFSDTVTAPENTIIIFIITSKTNNNNCNNENVSAAVLSASLSSRCGVSSRCDGGDWVQVWKIAVNIMNKK